MLQSDIEKYDAEIAGADDKPVATKAHASLTGDEILRIMKLAKSAGVKHFSCNGLVFDFV